MIDQPKLDILKSKLVLIVDDETRLRELILRQLRRRGLQCIGAESGNRALDLLQEQSVDILITDVRMPDGSGVDLLRGLHHREQPMPLSIVISGCSDHSVEELMALGASVFLPKPVRIRQLINVMSDALPS